MHINNPIPQNMIGLLNRKVEQWGIQEKIFFLNSNTNIQEAISYQALMLKAKIIAATIQQHTVPGDRVLLIYAPGIEFISAFFGCLYAGVIAVPVYPPAEKKLIEKLQAIISNAEPKIILSSEEIVSQIKKLNYINALKKSLLY